MHLVDDDRERAAVATGIPDLDLVTGRWPFPSECGGHHVGREVYIRGRLGRAGMGGPQRPPLDRVTHGEPAWLNDAAAVPFGNGRHGRHHRTRISTSREAVPPLASVVRASIRST